MNHFFRVKQAGLLLSLLSGFAAAQEFNGSLSASSGKSDNALKTEDGQADERQDIYSAGLSGNYTNQFLSASAEYLANKEHYSSGSQEDRSFVEGSAELMIGAPLDPLDLELKHSRRRLLTSPDALNISTNQDDREIASATPRLKKKISKADLITASADFTRIDYTRNELNNSDRVTGSLTWLRDISRVSNISLMVSQTDIKFKNFDSADYEYINSMLVYSAQLRKLSYSLAAGHNQSKREIGDTYSSPTYTLSIDYNTSYHNFRLTSDKAITDSSMGDGNISSVNLNPNNDSALNVGQIDRTNTELSWNTQVVCIRCTAGISLHTSKDEYLVFSDEAHERGGAINFSYAFSDRNRLSYRFNKMEQKFKGAVAGRDYNYITQLLEFSSDVSNSIAVRIFLEKEERESGAKDRAYTENFIGGAISYHF